jgi:tripartite-type tricarboxylate transporter receptor subunit TctC
MMLSVRGDSPYRTLRDFVEAGRAAPGRLTVSDSGLLATTPAWRDAREAG